MQTTDILERMIELIKEYPNDAELGAKIRTLYWNQCYNIAVREYKEKLNDDENKS